MTLKRSSFSYKAFSILTGLMLLVQYLSPIVGLYDIHNAEANGDGAGQAVCPETGGGWVKVDNLTGTSYTYIAPAGKLVSQYCYKAANVVNYGDVIPPTSSYTVVSTVLNDNNQVQDISHASFLLVDAPQLGSITILKATIPSGDMTSFGFMTDLPVGSFALSGDGDAEIFSNLSSGSYYFHEMLSNLWALTDVNCTGDLDGGSYWDSQLPVRYHIDLDAGENIVCTFTNAKNDPSVLRAVKYEDLDIDGVHDAGEPKIEGWGMNLYQGFGCGGILIDSQDTKGFGVARFENLPSGRYSVQEDIRDGWSNSTSTCKNIKLGWGETKTLKFGNYKLGKVMGRKYADLNSNGIHNLGEPRLNGWTIRLYDSGWNKLDEVVTGHTGKQGQYSFEGLLAGTYYISEVKDTDWYQTGLEAPNSNSSVVPNLSGESDEEPLSWMVVIDGSGQEILGRKFGNNEYEYGKIIVHKNVLAADGSEVDDPQVFVATIDGGLGDSNMSEGSPAVYNNVIPGIYTVDELPEPLGYQLMSVNTDEDTITSGTQIVLTSGETVDVYITNRQLPSAINVFKYIDANVNGMFDEGIDYGIGGWEFGLYEGMDCDMNASEEPILVLSTDVTGRVTFENLKSGTYSIKEYLSNGWIYPGIPVNGWSSDDAVCETVILGANEIKDISFGNFELGKVSGYKFNDIDGDGMWDIEEPALQGWNICLEKVMTEVNGLLTRDLLAVDSIDVMPIENCTLTDELGYYEFDNLSIGSYILTETLQDGWDQTVSPGVFSIVGTGDSVENMNFGNRFITSDLVITKVDDETEEPFNPGDRVTYTITVTNNGPYETENVIVTDTLSDDVEFAYTSTTHGTCSELNGVVTCELGTLDVDETATIIIGVDIGLLFTGDLENIAVVASDTPDSDSSNNEDDEFTKVVEKGEVKGEDIEPEDEPEPEPEVLAATGQDIRIWVSFGLLGMLIVTSLYVELKRKDR